MSHCRQVPSERLFKTCGTIESSFEEFWSVLPVGGDCGPEWRLASGGEVLGVSRRRGGGGLSVAGIFSNVDQNV